MFTRLCFGKYYISVAISLSKQGKIDADPKQIIQISFHGNLENNEKIFFIIEEAKEIVLDFSIGTVTVL